MNNDLTPNFAFSLKKMGFANRHSHLDSKAAQIAKLLILFQIVTFQFLTKNVYCCLQALFP